MKCLWSKRLKIAALILTAFFCFHASLVSAQVIEESSASASSNASPGLDEALADFNNGDNEGAIKIFWRLAGAGDAQAQYYLAYMQENGLGTGKDVYGSVSW